METFPASPGFGRGRKKLFGDSTIQSPGDNNLMSYVENMTQEQLNEAIHAMEKNPNVITVVDLNGNADSEKKPEKWTKN